MRKIKFRAWDKVFNRMFAPTMLDYETEENEILVWRTRFDDEKGNWISGGFKLGKEVELMQYAGLNDKNNVEIYEGDIVTYQSVYDDPIIGGKKTAKVVFSGCSFDPEGVSGWGRQGTVEVIGNIYENPELLEDAKC